MGWNTPPSPTHQAASRKERGAKAFRGAETLGVHAGLGHIVTPSLGLCGFCHFQVFGSHHVPHCCLIQQQPGMELAPVPGHGASYPAAASMPGGVQWMDTHACLLTHPSLLCAWLTLDRHGIQAGGVSRAQPALPSGWKKPSGHEQNSSSGNAGHRGFYLVNRHPKDPVTFCFFFHVTRTYIPGKYLTSS